MEVEENNSNHTPHHGNKRPRGGICNGSITGNIVSKLEEDQDEESKRKLTTWQHPSSRIYRVSRASGGKDRHSKVYTAKGIRDRRVRLSVSTAIQFYDLQDRLGFDQPSKAIEWLIKAASAAIDKLPTLDSVSFPIDPTKPNPVQDNRTEPDLETAPTGYNAQQQLTKSGCSSTSETSKGSVLSLSRSENRVKARERARERTTTKDKEKTQDESLSQCHHVAPPHQPSINQGASFTELLTGPVGNSSAAGAGGGGGQANSGDCVVQKHGWQLPSAAVVTTADYFGQAGLYSNTRKNHQIGTGFSTPALHPHLSNYSQMGMVPFNLSAAGPTVAVAPGQHPEMQQFSFLQDNLIPVTAVAANGDYNLNFSISSGLVGVNRGTLQSNSHSNNHIPSQHHHLQRLSSPIDGSNLPFFFGPAAATPAASGGAPAEPHYSALQLWDGYNSRHSEMKEKNKN